MRFLPVALAITLTLTGCAATPSTTATTSSTTWKDGACSEVSEGTTLDIQFEGKIITRCALKYSGNGWDLIKAGGLSVKGTKKYPTAMACQIDGLPANLKCDDTDPTDSYWMYYVSDTGSWQMAMTGAADHKSVCGQAEGWVWTVGTATKVQLPEPNNFSCKG